MQTRPILLHSFRTRNNIRPRPSPKIPSQRIPPVCFRQNDVVGSVETDEKGKNSGAEQEQANIPSGTSGRRDLPFSLIVNQREARLALCLAAIDPINLGGVLLAGELDAYMFFKFNNDVSDSSSFPTPTIYLNRFPSTTPTGGRGTGKSVLARSLHALLPNLLTPEGPPRRPPFVAVPLGVTEDRLLGAVDLEESVRRGLPVVQTGLLAASDGGLLVQDDLPLQEPKIASLVLEAVGTGVARVEREGVSAESPCRPLFVATCNPGEDDLTPGTIDRFAFIVALTPLTAAERQTAADINERFLDFRPSRPLDAGAETAELVAYAEQQDAALAVRIAAGRQRIAHVRLTPAQARYLVEQAVGAGCVGHRAECFAARAAQAHAAFSGRTAVAAADLEAAVALCIVPRALRAVVVRGPPPPPKAPAPPEPSPATPDKEPDKEQEEEEEKEGDQTQEEEKEEETSRDELPPIPQFLFQAEDVSGEDLGKDVLAAMRLAGRSTGAARSGRSKRSLIYGFERGRFIKPVLPRGRPVKLAVDATLRAAAPHQRFRHLHPPHGHALQTQRDGRPPRRVILTMDDVRVKYLARRAGVLFVFVVDASGSMALNRMAAAKGAAMELLMDSYKRRDQVALISCHGRRAELLLPPGRAVEQGRRKLEVLSTGGGTPLAHALAMAIRVSVGSLKKGDVTRAVIVLLTDGRATVPLSVSTAVRAEGPPPSASDSSGTTPSPGESEGVRPGVILVSEAERARIEPELMELARAARHAHVDMLVVDSTSRALAAAFSSAGGPAGNLGPGSITKRRGSGLAEELARMAGGKYVLLPGNRLSAAALRETTVGLASQRTV